MGAIVEGSAGLLRRTLLKKRSSRLQSARADKEAYSPDPKVAQALQRAHRGSSSSSRIPRPRQQFKLHSMPAYRPRSSLRAHPATPPPSPAKPPVRAGGAVKREDRAPAHEVSATPPRPTKGESASEGEFDGFVSLGGLPGAVASSLEC